LADICALLGFYAVQNPEERRSHLHLGGSLKSRTNVVNQSILLRKMPTCATKYLAITIIIIIIIIIIEVEHQW
jgi:hypothetical protein